MAQLQLREELSTARQLGLAINASRDAIGAAKGRIEAARVARAIATISSDGGGGGADDGGGGGAAEAAEAEAAAELHAGKQRYTAQAAELKQRKQHCAALQARYKAQQAVCEAEFAAWHRLMCGLHGLRLGAVSVPALRARLRRGLWRARDRRRRRRRRLCGPMVQDG